MTFRSGKLSVKKWVGLHGEEMDLGYAGCFGGSARLGDGEVVAFGGGHFDDGRGLIGLLLGVEKSTRQKMLDTAVAQREEEKSKPDRPELELVSRTFYTHGLLMVVLVVVSDVAVRC